MLPERPTGCPVCGWMYGFHDREKHDDLPIDSKHFKEKDWQKNADRTQSS